MQSAEVVEPRLLLLCCIPPLQYSSPPLAPSVLKKTSFPCNLRPDFVQVPYGTVVSTAGWPLRERRSSHEVQLTRPIIQWP